MKTKVCKQCGELRPLVQFRRYYGGRTGTYTRCKLCERINSRVKYLEHKDMTETEKAELAKIYQLYQLQRLAGLQPPGTPRMVKDLGKLVECLTNSLNSECQPNINDEQPAVVLRYWTEVDLTEEPDVYNVLYDDLADKFRPVLKIDSKTMLPVYDDTYKNELLKILRRFNDYEDSYDWRNRE